MSKRKSEMARVVIYTMTDAATFNGLPEVDIIASGYEFNCPSCDTYNKLVAVPKFGRAVECHKCKTRFRVGGANDARD